MDSFNAKRFFPNTTKNTFENSSYGKETAFGDLIPVLIQCFTIILVGYISGKSGLISGKGSAALNTFMAYFSLPSLIFSSLVTIDFSGVKWAFLASVFLAKTIVFIIVVIVTLVLTRPTSSGIAGLYAIFCTQSNDFALGYPLVSSLYKKKSAYLAQYIYLLVPIQLLILNPVGFFMMEIDKQRRLLDDKDSDQIKSKEEPKNIFCAVFKGIITNPVIVLTALGIIGNVAFQHNPPVIIMGILETFASAFSALALFQLGQNMVGKRNKISGYGLIEPAILILMKILVLPILIRELVNQLPVSFTDEERDEFGSFGFLYGTFPTAPPVFIYASQFNLDDHIVSTGMVACTILSAPLMLISATMTKLPISDFNQFRATLINTVFYTCLASLGCCIWVFITLAINQKWKSITHFITMNLIAMQLLTAVGGLLWYFIDSDSKPLFYSQYIITVMGVFSARVWTALLAGTLAFLRWRSLCYVLSYQKIIVCVGHFISVISTIALIVGIFYRPPQKYIPDPNFQFGQPEAYVAFSVLATCLLFTVMCLIIQQRFHYQITAHYKLLNSDDSDEQNTNQTEISPLTIPVSIPDIEDISNLIRRSTTNNGNCEILCSQRHGCSEGVRKRCTSEVRQYLMEGCHKEEMEIQHQFNHHVVLLILLSISMTVGLAVCIWKIIGENQTGIFIELEFLDVILNFGQGIFTFTIFGLNYTIIKKPIFKLYQRIRFGTSNFVLPAKNKLKPSTLQVCHQFMTYHYETCTSELVCDKRVGRKVYPAAFRGKELVTWILAIGLADDRNEGEAYGKELVLGRVIEHVDAVEDFYDDIKIYQFLPIQSQIYSADLSALINEEYISNEESLPNEDGLFSRSRSNSSHQNIEVLIHAYGSP